MEITVNLWSKKRGELKRFLDSYYCRRGSVSENVDRWICVYKKSVDAVDIISALTDNADKYQIGMFIQVNGGEIYPITAENHNDVIKSIFQLSDMEALQKSSKTLLA